jgi:protease I
MIGMKIAVLLDDLFEDVEYFQPVGAFSAAGHKIYNVGVRKGKVVKGKTQGKEVDIDESIQDVSVGEYDALLIPGGCSPDKLRAHDEVVDFVKDFVESCKPVFAICHGPQLLITADVLKNRTVTGWKSIIQDIKNAGAVFLDKEVVVDENLVTSRGPNDLKAFIEASLQKLKEGE